jgi:hypothetical protein
VQTGDEVLRQNCGRLLRSNAHRPLTRPPGLRRRGQVRSEEKSLSHSQAATQKTGWSSGSCPRDMICGLNFSCFAG